MSRRPADRSAAALASAALLGAAALTLSAGPALAGAWTLEEGRGQAISTVTYYWTESEFDGRGVRTGGSRYERFEFSPYLEYGLTDALTFGLQPRFQYLVQENAGAADSTNGGASDVDLFLRQRLWRDDFSVLSFQGLVKLPTGYSDDSSPALGNGQLDVEPRLLFGRGFAFRGWTGFADLSLGYRHRAGPPADELRPEATFGISPWPDWQLLVQSLNNVGLRNETQGGADYDVYKLQLSVVHDLDERVAVQVGGWSEVAGRNAGGGTALFGALWLRF